MGVFMNKKLLVSLFLCLFIFSSGLFAEKKEEEAKTIQFLLRKDLLDAYYYEVDWHTKLCEVNIFKSDPIYLGHVPASPKAEAIFFELWFQYWYDFEFSCTKKRTTGGLSLEIINPDVIPAGLEVLCGATYFTLTDMFPGDWQTDGEDRMTFSDKYCLFRDNAWFWSVRDKDTKVPVSNEEAISIINKLIRKGFDIQFYVWGNVQGAYNMLLNWICMEVTRIQ